MATRGDTLDQCLAQRHDCNEVRADAVISASGLRFLKLHVLATSICNKAFCRYPWQVTVPHDFVTIL